jgi:hypothetical protein
LGEALTQPTFEPGTSGMQAEICTGCINYGVERFENITWAEIPFMLFEK